MSRLIRNKKLIGSTSNDSSHIIYDPSDTSRSETTVKSELDRLNAGIPAVDVGNATTDWTNTETATSATQGASNYSTLNAMSPSSTIKSLLTSIKSLLFGLSTQVTSLNTELNDKQIIVVSATATNGVYDIALPNGYTQENTILISASVKYSNNWYTDVADTINGTIIPMPPIYNLCITPADHIQGRISVQALGASAQAKFFIKKV